MLQKYDAEQDEARWKFDLERDEVLRKFMAALWGVELRDDPARPPKPSHANRRKRTMTQQDIMRNYAR